MEKTFTGVFERDGDWWIGYTEELPGAFGQGKTLDECRESLREAIVLVLETRRELRERQP
jgi:predicted RNase H-like HicB family nuclease